jgi:hypothetical protein
MHQRRNQPRQVVLQQVVAGAVAHGLDRRVLADLAGNQDEGHVQTAGLEQVQCHQAGEAGQVEIGQHHVPFLLERGQEGRLGVDAQGLHLQAAAAQVRQGQFVVQRRILQVQDAQRMVEDRGRHA